MIPGGFFNLKKISAPRAYLASARGSICGRARRFGNIWRGADEKASGDSVRYTFDDANGRTITELSDSPGLVLRDRRGKTWRGFIDESLFFTLRRHSGAWNQSLIMEVLRRSGD
jgi:hypothetical protein